MPPSVGSKAPEFSLVDQDHRLRTLSEFYAKGNTILAFFPGAFTSVCTHEMCTFRDSLSKLERLKAQPVGISVNDPWTLKGFAERNMLTFPLLSDYSRETVRKYGVELRDFANLKGYSVAQRSVFIVDMTGIIRFVWVATEPGIEPDYGLIEEELAKIR